MADTPGYENQRQDYKPEVIEATHQCAEMKALFPCAKIPIWLVKVDGIWWTHEEFAHSYTRTFMFIHCAYCGIKLE